MTLLKANGGDLWVSKSPEIKTKSSESRATTLKEKYEEFIHEAERLFPKVDQKLLLTILQFQTEYTDWEGNVLLKIVYPPGHNMEQKKELFYSKYGCMSSIDQHKTLRMKAIRMYI